MTDKLIKGHPGIGPIVKGYALVANDNFSARYDLDRKNGVFSRPNHLLFKESFVNKILVLNVAKGGVASAWMFKSMKENSITPLGLLLNIANPIIAQGAAHANLSLIDRFQGDITKIIKTGNYLVLNPQLGTVEIKQL